MLSCTLPVSAYPVGCAGSWVVFPAPCASGPVLLESRSWLHSSLCPEPLPKLPPSCSRVQPCTHYSSFGSSAAGFGVLSLGHRSSVSVPGSLRASPPLLGSCSNSLGAPFPPGRLVKLLLLQAGLSCPGDTGLGLSPPSRGPLPLGCLLFLYFFFPCLPTLIEA